MPNGKTHARATLALAVDSGVLSYQMGQPLQYAAALAGGALTGLVLTPDLDVDGGCISDDFVREYAGRPAGWFWSLYWRPYSRIIPHRSRLSHAPVLGTALRLLYLSILPALVWWFASGAMPRPDFPSWSIWAVGGLALADALHYLMDRLL
jgi:uncharacterized metal-binding protein